MRTEILISIIIVLCSIGLLLLNGSLTTGLNPVEYVVVTFKEIKDKLLNYK